VRSSKHCKTDQIVIRFMESQNYTQCELRAKTGVTVNCKIFGLDDFTVRYISDSRFVSRVYRVECTKESHQGIPPTLSSPI
jgi:hypothetical protein